ncbi:hypothetical protein D1B31_23735 [Neobacillus notoginsengisoli]|uniref:Uncharacterized protein n=2 Tax=Neobacillus notoginsengisoli TaxID=1578198 RepID=A0A417YCS6_9BACI|nr:hypothetical protein D1B31_23735 [Neobacillus notoginsengisoli]
MLESDINTLRSNIESNNNTSIEINYNKISNLDKGEGSSNLNKLNNNFYLENLISNSKINVEYLNEHNFNYYLPNDRDMEEVFTIKGQNSSENYLGGIDKFGVIHLNADILDNPYFNLVPGVDFIEGFDSYAIYDYDSPFFKNMIEAAYKNRTQDTILDFFDSEPNNWYQIQNRIEARDYIFELIQKDYNINFFDESDIEDNEFFNNKNFNSLKIDKGKGKES